MKANIYKSREKGKRIENQQPVIAYVDYQESTGRAYALNLDGTSVICPLEMCSLSKIGANGFALRGVERQYNDDSQLYYQEWWVVPLVSVV